jgi:hypothetical protein
MAERDQVRACDAAAAPSSRRAAAVWCLAGAAGVTLLVFVAAHLPRKPIGLAALAFGALTAWGLLWLATELRLAGGRRLLAAAAVLILAGQVGIALESHRVFAARERQRWGPDPAAWIREGISRGTDQSGETTAALVLAAEERRRLLEQITSFPAYLQFRLSNVGTFAIESPWPPLIWGIEVLAGTGLGLWLGRRIALATGTAPAKLGDGGERPLRRDRRGDSEPA